MSHFSLLQIRGWQALLSSEPFLGNIVFHYIERYFGISPDNHNGSLEVAFELIVMVLLFMLIMRLMKQW
jgi:hypothetical protein